MMKETQTVLPAAMGRTRMVLLAIMSGGLVWLIVTRSLAAALATSNPSVALLLQPAEPQALLARAKAELNSLLAVVPPQADTPGPEAQDPPDRIAGLSRLAELALLARDRLPVNTAEVPAGPAATSASDPSVPAPVATPEQTRPIGGLAAQVLAVDPLNADALGLLAQLAELTVDPKTGPLMQAAARLSVRESYAHYWLLQEARRKGDDATVLHQADTLLRTRPRTLPLLLPELGRIAESGGGAQILGTLLAADPPWRKTVLARLPSAITDARTPLNLLLGLQGSPHPPTEDEISRYIAFLISRKFHELAYYTWLQFLPPERLVSLTPLNNPGFDLPLSGSSFDWALRQGRGFTAEIRPLPDRTDGLALFVEFTHGRAEFPGVSQTVLLGPGNYTLTGKYKGTLAGTRGLVWRVQCVDGPIVAQTDLLRGDVPTWRDFTVSVTIPPTGCRAQTMRLDLDARSASEKFVTGSMWFDDLALKRSGILTPVPNEKSNTP